MHKILFFLKLFRWHNLLMVVLIMYLFRYFIIQPLVTAAGFELVLRGIDFFLLVLSVILITAAGYVINDYFDLRIDRINKPERVIVGRHVSRRSAIIAHWALNSISVILGFYLAWRIKFWPLAPVIAMVPLLLWSYSFWLKRSFLIGNLTVALLAGLLIPLVWIVECKAADFDQGYQLYSASWSFFVLVYSLFAFFSTLTRELVKDMEDFTGDQRAGCKTLTVVAGLEKTRNVVIALLTFIILSLAVYSVFLISDTHITLAAYFLVAVILPFAATLYFTCKAFGSLDFKLIQSLLKIAMLTGILSMMAQYLFIGS
ncbi:MAG TPA: geranylgeranylglycerol-phosphate geranylgeranyltransferase [Bacteroidales bacterium]|nr:geranylgeranylglycerol-phosphate geranylgeranyltransferase [Bacteroidales bacterium]